MQKIPTLFLRDPDDMRRVTREVHPDCKWVLDGHGTPTRKYDGTCVLRDEDGWWARREVKPGKKPPANYRPVETDEVTGKTVGWEPIGQSAFAKYHAEALADPRLVGEWKIGTYELCGPKVNGNPEGFEGHILVLHEYADALEDGFDDTRVPRDFDGLADYLSSLPYEGVVWHHPDGRMAKLKRRDFPSS